MPPTHTPNGTVIGDPPLFGLTWTDSETRERLRAALGSEPPERTVLGGAFSWAAAPQGATFWRDAHAAFGGGAPLSDDVRLILEVWLGLWREPVTPPTETPNGVTTAFDADAMMDDWRDFAREALDGVQRADRANPITNMMTWSETPQGQDFWSAEEGNWLRRDAHVISDDARMILQIWLGEWRPEPAIPPMPAGMTREIAQRALDETLTNSEYYHGVMGANVPSWNAATFHDWPEADREAVAAEKRFAGSSPGNARPPVWGARTRALLTAWATGEAQAPLPLPQPTGWVEPTWVRHEKTYYEDYLTRAKGAVTNGSDPRTWGDWIAIMLPGDEEDGAFEVFDASDAAEAARKASPQWPAIQIARRNWIRAEQLGAERLPMPAPAVVAAPVAPKRRKPLKRVNVEAIKAKYPAINGATAGCSCGVCAKLRKGAEGQDPLTARTEAQVKAQKEYAEKGRTFGVEIECFLPNNPALSASRLNQNHVLMLALASAGLKSHAAQSTGDIWGLKSDGSLRPNKSGDLGVELVSPILRGEAGLADLAKVAGVLNGLNAYVNKSAGLHVHIGAKDLTVEQRRNLLSQFVRYERFFNLILPASRRENRYATSLRKRASATKTDSTKAAEHIILTLLSVRDERELVQALNADDHHLALSDARGKHGTFEFRQHSGTVNAEKMVNWVRLVLAFVEAAKDKPALPFYSRKLTDEEEMEKFFETFAVARDLRAYYRKRHAALYANPENDD